MIVAERIQIAVQCVWPRIDQYKIVYNGLSQRFTLFISLPSCKHERYQESSFLLFRFCKSISLVTIQRPVQSFTVGNFKSGSKPLKVQIKVIAASKTGQCVAFSTNTFLLQKMIQVILYHFSWW